MMIPTLDQTEGIWIGRTANEGFHYVRDVFPGETAHEIWHRTNCLALILRGHLRGEFEDGSIDETSRWEAKQRYRRVHV